MMFFVFDLDGTLADCQHRVHLIDGSDEGYRKFFAACVDDTVIFHVRHILWSLQYDNDIEIWSGRSDEVRPQTHEWLVANGIRPTYLKWMREADDHRPDDVIKREFLRRSVRRPDIVFDDRKRVVDMWRSEGIPCFQVADGDF